MRVTSSPIFASHAEFFFQLAPERVARLLALLDIRRRGTPTSGETAGGGCAGKSGSFRVSPKDQCGRDALDGTATPRWFRLCKYFASFPAAQ